MRGMIGVPVLLVLAACGGHVDSSSTFATPSTAVVDAGVTRRAAPIIPATWTRIEPREKEPFPGALVRPSLVAKGPSRSLLLYGQRVGSQPEVWERDPYTTTTSPAPGWKNLTTDLPAPTWPTGASFRSPAIYDAYRGALVLAGAPTNGSAWFGEFFVAKNAWQVDDASHARSWASDCNDCGLAYDPSSGVRWFATADHHGQTVAWEWDVDAATMVPAGAPFTETRASHMIYDAKRHVPVWISVGGGTTAMIEMWTWNGSSWRQRDSAADAPWPPTRDDFRVAFDPQGDRILLMGGLTRLGGQQPMSDLWSYDLERGTWSELRPATDDAPWPEPRAGHGMTVDDAVGALYVYGGDGATGPLADFWALPLR